MFLMLRLTKGDGPTVQGLARAMFHRNKSRRLELDLMQSFPRQ